MIHSATFTFPIRPEDKLRLPNLTHLQIIGLWAGAMPPQQSPNSPHTSVREIAVKVLAGEAGKDGSAQCQ